MAEAARRSAYRLLAGLVAGSAEAAASARSIDPIGEWLAEIDDDELAAAHHQAFARGAYPYAGVYLGAEALVGGDAADRVASIAIALGLDWQGRGDSADHLAVSLDLLAEVEAGVGREVLHVLAAWLPPWAAAAAAAPPPYAAIARLIVELVAADLAALSPPPVAPLAAPAFAVTSGSNLADVARQLCRPAVAGALLSLGDIQAVARRLDLPTGFGARRLMLANLLGAAGERGAGDEALRELAAQLASAAAAIDAVAPLARWGRPWSERARDTAARLEAMAARLRGADAVG